VESILKKVFEENYGLIAECYHVYYYMGLRRGYKD